MAQDKRVFTGGMDKDSDPRLVKGGDYRDALNIRNTSSSDGTSGSVENMEGNTLVHYGFIDEADEIIEVTPIGDGEFEIIEVETSQTFFQQQIIFTGREIDHDFYNHTLYYYNTNTDGFASIASSYIYWVGTQAQTNTAYQLYNLYGPGGPLSVLNVIDITTGNVIEIQAEIDFNSNSQLDPGYDSPFTVTYTSTQADAEFCLQVYGGVNDDNFATNINDFSLSDVENIGAGINATYETSFVTVPSYNSNLDDENNSFGLNGGSNSQGSEYEFQVTGPEPTDPSEEAADLGIFSYDQVGEVDSEDGYQVAPFIDLNEVSAGTGSGGDYEFGSGTSLSNSLLNILQTDKYGNVLIIGGSGTTTTIGLATADFVNDTVLEGNNSSAPRNNPSEASYSQIEYYYNNTEVTEGDGFTISQGTLTFSGEEVLSSNYYVLKSNILGNKNYLLSFTVSGLPSGKSFTITSGNTSIGKVTTNGIKSLYFEATGNSSVIYLQISDDFSTSESFTISNLRLFLEKMPVTKLSINFKSLGSAQFKLALATSAEQLKKDLVAGRVNSQVNEWYPGVGLSLISKSIGSDDISALGNTITDLQEQLNEANTSIASLYTSIANINADHTEELATLQTALSIAEARLSEVQSELATAQAAQTAIDNQLTTLYDHYEILSSAVNSLGSEGVSGTVGLEAYVTNISELSLGLDAVNTALSEFSTNNIINSNLQSDLEQAILDHNDLSIAHDELVQELETANSTIGTLEETITSNATSLDSLTQQITKLELDLETAVANEDNGDTPYSQAQLDSLTAEHNIAISDLQDEYNNQITKLEADILLFDEDSDGVNDLQSQVDSLQAQLDAIELYNENNPTTLGLTEHIDDTKFQDENEWSLGNGWSFDSNGATFKNGAVSSNINLHQNFDSTLDRGEYILSFKCSRINKGSFKVRTSRLVSNIPVNPSNHGEFSTSGRVVLSINIEADGDRIFIQPTSIDSDFSISELSLSKTTGSSTVTATTIASLFEFTTELKNNNAELIESNLSLNSTIEGLSSELTAANTQISNFTNNLSSILSSLESLGSNIDLAITDLSLTSSVTQVDIDELISNFNSSNANINEQVEFLSSLISLLNNQITDLELNEGIDNSLSDKWMFTFSGGIPVRSDGSFPTNLDVTNLVIKNSDTSFSLVNESNIPVYSPASIVPNFVTFDYPTNVNKHLLFSFLEGLNNLTGRADYTSDLEDKATGEVITFPVSFIIPFSNNSGDLIRIKATVYNYNLDFLDGDGTLNNQGDISLHENSDYLAGQGVTDGIQVEFEALDGSTGWEFYTKINEVEKELTNGSKTQLALESNFSYSWNTSTPTTPGHETHNGLDFRMYFEQKQASEVSPLGRNLKGSVENFVSRAAEPSYSMLDLAASENFIYPSGSSDIILNKSSDVKANLSGNIIGAKKYIKNVLLGTTKVSSNLSDDYKCIGTYEDKPTSSIYYFVHNNSNDRFDCILEYNLIDDQVRTVYQDGRISSKGEGETRNILNFSKDHAITGVNKVDDILYWTDNLNRPRKINVRLAKKNESNIVSSSNRFEDIYFNTFNSSAFLTYKDQMFDVGDDIYTHVNYSGISSFNGYAEVTGIVRKMPEDLTFDVNSTTTVTTSSALFNSQLSEGEFIGIMDSTGFPTYYQVESISGSTITTVEPVGFTLSGALPLQLNGLSIGAVLTNCPFLQSYNLLPGIMLLANPSDAYSPLITYGTYEDKMRYLDVVKHQPYKRPSVFPTIDPGYAKNNILDNLFQFKYRYIHHDNENTSYSGISNIEIDPEFARNTPLKFTEYALTANNIEVEYFDSISDVTKLEIVARKGNNGEFVLVDTVENNFIKYLKVLKNEHISTVPDQDVSFFLFEINKSFINFRNNGVYPFVDKGDSDKLFDAVPKLAKAQTIISDNRLTYGNILEGYDNTPLVVSSTFTTEGLSPIENVSQNFSTFMHETANSSQVFDGQVSGSITGNPSSAAANVPMAQVLTDETNSSTWGVGESSKLRMSWRMDFSGMNLNDVNSQTLVINMSYRIKREQNLGATNRRAGRFSMNLDVTGLTTINQVINRIIQKFNADDWEGGTATGSTLYSNCSKDSGSITLTHESPSRLEIRFVHEENNEDSNHNSGQALWDQGDNDGWCSAHTNSLFKLISGSPGTGTFKTGAFHDFGIAYFDETNRCSFVNAAPDYGNEVPLQDKFNDEVLNVNLNGTRAYNAFLTEDGGLGLGQPSSVKFSIYNKPPLWATSYQFVYAGNTSVDEFMQVSVPLVIPGSGSGDTQMYLSLQSLKGHKSSYTEATASLIDFEVADGDRIRFISCNVDGSRRTFTNYLDFEITGFDFYQVGTASVDGNPITIANGQEGFYISIANPGSVQVGLEGASDVSIDHSGFSLDGSGYDLLVAELYRPKKTQTPENLVYYEIGDRYEIGNHGTGQRYHNGDIAQIPDYFTDKDVSTEVSLTPAIISITTGDVYIKPRVMFTQQDGAAFESFACEDYYLNDFHNTNHYDKGRVNVINNNAAERRLDASVYYSETYVSTGAINGLSSFNLAHTPYFDYNKEFGSIQSLKNSDNDLMIFHESKVGRVLVKEDVLRTASGDGLVSLSNNIISNYSTLYAGQFGCGLNPESIVRHGKKFYFADIKRGSILRLSTDGLTVISDYGMKDYFRDIGELYIKYNPDNIQTFEDSNFNKLAAPYLVIGGYDPKYDEYVITIPSIEVGRRNYSTGNTDTVKNWSDGIATWDNSTSLVNLKVDDTVFNAVTLGFSEGTNKWTSFYSFVPDFYSKINKQFVSFKEGRTYRHNDSDIYSRSQSKFNKFYGNDNLSYIDFIFNADPSSIKTYNAISLESDTKFITGMFTNMGQYYGNYDDVITTSIAFKKVDGTINNYQGEDSNYISGNNTEFYDSVSPGDLVRVFGYEKRDAIVKDFIVTKIVSNELITVNEPLNLDITNSYMLVIDYKSKESIQYSNIPFASSGVDSLNDNTNFGDGSEIIGVGTPDYGFIFPNTGLCAGIFNDASIPSSQVLPIEMISGAEYVIHSLNNDTTFDVSDVDPSLSSADTVVGKVFTCKYPSTNSSVSLLSTNHKLYIKFEDNKTYFLGYINTYGNPYPNGNITVHFIKNTGYTNTTDLDKGFLFIVKNGNVEGEGMKGSYMRTILATNNNQSKKKFNLYSANADVDKSELSGTK